MAVRVPWALDEQVEQDLAISRAIVDVFSDGCLAEALAFRGGTALHNTTSPHRARGRIAARSNTAGPGARLLYFRASCYN